ncbi:MAG: hydrogenase maturation nickel metallochaperone HypA [Armatimonadota bacterium]|nr:hydrogenase maturation nickel metallochaperone HypA [bacterium]MDW8104611.1 hydrogenase maturation nickel metallochaperone HypA [Armatimonadota bacterium]MDW8291001.1 hydrogenase maturation nickel metallochaperone HypA [Armatimonadota bacterium]
MHEFSIAEAIVHAAQEVAQAHGGGKVEAVRLRIGELRQVVPEALLFAFDVLKQETPLAEASLQWENVPARVRCRECHTEYHPEDVFWECPACGAFGGEVLAGEELEIIGVTLWGGTHGD